MSIGCGDDFLKLGCFLPHLISTPDHTPRNQRTKLRPWNLNVESFLAEIALQKLQAIDELYRLLSIWVEDGHNHRSHSSLEGQTPAERFQQDE